MIQLITIIKVLLHLVTIPLFISWFYFLYYMAFKDFKIGLLFFVANIVIGYVIIFTNKALSSYQMRLIAYAACENENEKAEVKKALKNANF